MQTSVKLTGSLIHARNRVKSKAKRAHKNLVNVTQHSLISGFFGEMHGGERLVFAMFVLSLFALCVAHIGVGVRGLTEKDNVQYRTSVEFADSDFWTTGPLAGSDLWFASSGCTPVGTSISYMTCQALDITIYDDTHPLDFPSVCRQVSSPEGSLFAPVGASQYPFTCCACFYPMSIYNSGNYNLRIAFEGGEKSGSYFVAGKTSLVNMAGVVNTKEDNWQEHAFDVFLEEDIYKVDETWAVLMPPLQLCHKGENTTTVAQLFFRNVSARAVVVAVASCHKNHAQRLF